jgi:hypothetical protein
MPNSFVDLYSRWLRHARSVNEWGIMIGSTAVGVDAIREKTLVKIFGDRYVLKSPYEYRILWGESANTSPEIRALIDKLLLAAGKNPEFGDQGYS